MRRAGQISTLASTSRSDAPEYSHTSTVERNAHRTRPFLLVFVALPFENRGCRQITTMLHGSHTRWGLPEYIFPECLQAAARHS